MIHERILDTTTCLPQMHNLASRIKKSHPHRASAATAAVAHATELSPHASRGVEAVEAQRWSFKASPNGNFDELRFLLCHISLIVSTCQSLMFSATREDSVCALNEEDDGV